MRGPSLSVVIPAYNGEKYIAEAIESTLEQEYEPLELIVVDDGSTDRTARIAGGYPEVRLVSRKNGGPAAARNTGVAAGSGELLAFHDQDDVMLPGRFDRQIGHMLEHPEDEVTLGSQELLIEDGAPLPDWDRMLAPALFEQAGPQETFVGSISLVVWRRVFDRIGPFHEGIFGGDDLDWMLRASEAGVGMKRLEQPLVRRRIHHDNISQDFEACRNALVQCFHNRVIRKRGRDTTPGRELMPFPPPAS